MATKQEKVRTKPKKKTEISISSPFSFYHVQHVAVGEIDTFTTTTTTNTVTTSSNSSSGNNSITISPTDYGNCRPISAPALGKMSTEYSNAKEMDKQIVLTGDTITDLIKSEIANAIRAELEPIKLCQERIERRLDASGVFTSDVEYSEIERSEPVANEYQVDDEEEDPTYVNSESFQRRPSPRRLKRPSLSNPTYYEYSGDNIIPVNESESHSGLFSLSSQTSLKKPMPSPRLHHHETRPRHASIDSTTSRNSHLIARSLSNPAHDRSEEQGLDTKGKGAVLKQSSVCSETSLKRHMLPLPTPRPKTPRPNTLPRGRSSPQADTRRPSAPMLHRKGHHANIADERQCLAKALQSNIEDIVDNLIFTGSELPDELAQDSCITDEESSELRNIPNKKDQIRVLISTIKGRDLRVLQRFLARIEKTNKDIADKITVTFEDYKNTLKKRCICSCCEMRTNVNIKYVVDGLWSIDAISDGLFTDIARCSYSTVEQTTLWQRLIDSLNNAGKELRQAAYRRLVRALSSRNHYKYIAVDIETSISKYGKLECRCRVHHSPLAGSFTTVSSVSPWSSVSDVRASNEKLSGTGEFKLGELAGPDAPDGGDVSHDGGADRGSQKDESAREAPIACGHVNETPSAIEAANRYAVNDVPFTREAASGHGSVVKETPSIQISKCPSRRIVRQNAVD